MQVDFKEISEKPYVIYGAQVVAYGAYRALKALYHSTPECFVVSSLINNPTEIDGVTVKSIDEIPKETMIIICVTELLQDEIINKLVNKGFCHYIKLTHELEYQLMGLFYQLEKRFLLAETTPIQKKVELKLYEVKNHRDKVLSFHPKLQSYEIPIQAGRSIADVEIATCVDNIGLNISEKNRQYCEMTATYWVWKNVSCDWKGIEHYRRHLMVRPEMLNDDIDVIMPLPYLCYPNTISQFSRFVSVDVVEALFKALQELHPDEYENYKKVLYGEYQYTYNLVCAKEKVFNEYCAWFFEITEYMERMVTSVPEIGNTRALSYVAEVLTNLYFMSNSSTLKIRHVNKEIYV